MIIALSGFAGVGKDTVADCLRDQHNFMKMAIADPLKWAAQSIFAFSRDQLWGPSSSREAPDMRYPREHTWKLDNGMHVCACCRVCKETLEGDTRQCFLTPRYALQLLGTEFGRHCYDTIWIEAALRTARSQMVRDVESPYNGVVFTDVRFANELRGIQEFGRRENTRLEALVKEWHQHQHVGAGREKTLAEFLEMDTEEYDKLAAYGLHRLSTKMVRVTRPGFEKPRFDHPSEREQLTFTDADFDYMLVGVQPPKDMLADEAKELVSKSVSEAVTGMLTSFHKLP